MKFLFFHRISTRNLYRLAAVMALLVSVIFTPGTVQADDDPVEPDQAQANPITVYLPTVIQPDCRTSCYYFDSVNGSDSFSGRTPDKPWKSLTKINATNYPAGSTVHFMSGSTWTGAMVIDTSGTAEKPIRFTIYGDRSTLPTFRNPNAPNLWTSPAIKIQADWVILEFVKVVDARLAGVYIDTGADNNIVQGIEATRVGEGVNVHGRFNKILNNYIHDLVLVTNTDNDGDDDYGAVGVWLFNSDNEVAFNRIINCKAPSFDYGEDGGAVEFYKDVHRSYVHHNYANNTKGFTEIGGGSAYDNVIAYNLMVNTGRPLGLHLGGVFGSDIKNLRFENNTVIDTTTEGFWAAVLFLDANPTAQTLVMRNNIFYLLHFELFTNLTNPVFTHENNLFYLPNGTLNFTRNASEFYGDPKFTDLGAGDFRLQTTSSAVDRAINLGYAVDYNLLSVPSGAAPDMGAFEQQQLQALPVE